MLATFYATLSPMLVMFICMVIGFVLNRKKLLPENGATVLSKLENYVLVPALIIKTFMENCTVKSLSENYTIILSSAFCLMLAVVVAVPLARAFTKDAYTINIYRYALSFGNFGFMGNAIVPAILGAGALYHYMLFTLLFNAAVYTWGVLILIPKGEEKKSILKCLINPIFIAIIIGMVLGLTGATPYIPEFVTNSVGSLSACMGPLAMVLTGFVIGDYDILALLKKGRIYIATFLRLIVFPVCFVLLLSLTGASKEILSLAFFVYATPLGLNTVVFPAAYGSDTSTGASMAMISHTLCVITIPLLFAFFKSINIL